MKRRKFLKMVAKGVPLGIGFAQVGCTYLDQYFEIEKLHYDKEVFIFGGGVAGLTAAYELKKLNIPYRLFEASDRVGGRILSQRFPRIEETSEFGARWVDASDHAVFELVKELGLELEDSGLSRLAQSFYLGKESLSFKTLTQTYSATFKSWNRELAKIKRIFDLLSSDPLDPDLKLELNAYQSISFADILRDSQLDSKGRQLFKSWAQWGFQKSDQNISYLEFILWYETQTFSGSKHFLPGGLSQVVDILGQRVSGVIPDYNLQIDSKLIEIQRSQNKWECSIQGSNSLKKLSTRYVIVALPYNQLKNIKGIDLIFTNSDFKSSIKQADFKNQIRSFWKSKSTSSKPDGTYYFFESITAEVTKYRGQWMIDFDSAGSREKWSQVRNTVMAFFDIKDLEWVGEMNWSQKSFISGSAILLQNMDIGVLRTRLLDDWSNISFQLAGDYLLNPHSGSINDSILTAKLAAKNIYELIQERNVEV